jgi:hypothetical protein
VAVRGGRTSTQQLPLFSYYTFEPPESSGREAVVIGIDFRPEGDRVTVQGDISTEETGRILYDRDCHREVPPSAAAVIAAAREVAALLAARTDVLAEPLAPASQSRTL